MTILALTFNTCNVYFHNLQSIMLEAHLRMGFENEKGMGQKEYHECNLTNLFAWKVQVHTIAFTQ